MSKWILIEVVNQDIAEPNTFDSYDEAFSEMKHRYDDMLKDSVDGDEYSIHKDYASIQFICDNFDWRIYEVKI